MIVQRPAADGSRVLVPMTEHLRTAAALGAAYGNSRFMPPAPPELFTWVVGHHDDGWREFDQSPPLDPATGLPPSIDGLDFDTALAIGRRSIAANLERHPWCGLLVSRHVTGLYCARHGLEARGVVADIPPASRAAVDVFLAERREHDAALRDDLAADRASATWIAEPAFSHAYAVLELLDALAVWLNLRAPDQPDAWDFPALPDARSEPVRLHARSVADRVTIDPWPFATEAVEVRFAGTRVHRRGTRRESITQSIRLVPA